MANWREYTTKTKPEDTDEIMIADTKANANKRTLFSGLWIWIADKLATAVISQLETQNKSIIPALNELNSNALSDIKNVNWTTSKKKFEIDVSSFASTNYHYGFLMYGWSERIELLPFSFSIIPSDTFVNLKENSPVTAVIENNKITFSLIDDTFWGGIRVLLFK